MLAWLQRDDWHFVHKLPSVMKEKKLKAMVEKEIIFVEDLHLQVALISWQKVL